MTLKSLYLRNHFKVIYIFHLNKIGIFSSARPWSSRVNWDGSLFLSFQLLMLYIYIHGLIRLSLSKADRKNEKKIDRSFRVREKTKYSSYFCWGIYFKKFLLGTWKYYFEKIWYSCSVFGALPSDVIFINSARSWKFSNQLICEFSNIKTHQISKLASI